MYSDERNYGCRISDEWTYRGLRTLVLENDLLRISLLLDHGSDIFEFLYKPRDLDFLWRSPTGVRRQPWLDSFADPVGPFLDYHEGGWQEVLPNGGRVCQYEGAHLGLHSEVWALPWQHKIVDDGVDSISVTMWVRCIRTPFLLEKTLTLQRGEPALEITEAVTNEGEVELPLMWGHHPAFSPQFVDHHAVLKMPKCEVVCDRNVGEVSRFEPGQRFPWPVGVARDGQETDLSRLPAHGSGISDMLYLTELAEGWAEIENEKQQLTFRFDFDVTTFRHCWLYMEFGGTKGFWAWGRHNTLCLEPFSSWPAILPNAIQQGTELRLGPRQRRETWLRASVLAR
ncbi:MAG: aldose 1-epimerase [Candidatus Zipacnadales bacterium]